MIKLASITLLTPPRTDVCVWYTEAWMLLSVTQSQKCLSYCPCVCLPSSPLSPCTADQIKWTVHQSLSVLIIPAVCFHLSPPLKYGHGSSILLFFRFHPYSCRFSNSRKSVALLGAAKYRVESLPRFGVQGQEWDSSSRYQRTWIKRQRCCRQSAVGHLFRTYLNVVLFTCTMCKECKSTWPALRLLSFIRIVIEFCRLSFTPGVRQHIQKTLFLLVCVFLTPKSNEWYLAQTWMTDSHLSSDHLITSEMGYAHMICFVNP